METKEIDVQGHRGCRGLMPENTLEGFAKAQALGVNTLELDVVMTQDSQIVVSHEAWFHQDFCLDPQGQAIPESEAKSHNIWQMTYAEVRQYDCGSKPHPHFPKQEKFKVAKPLLSELFELMADKCGGKPDCIKYSIELKTEPSDSVQFNPPAAIFVEKVTALIEGFGLKEKTVLQAFDLAILQEIHARHPGWKTALLVEPEEDIPTQLQKLGFTPEVLSPNHEKVDAELVAFAQQKGMALIPWTVNEIPEMQRMIDLGVPGIITDYPDVLLDLLGR